VTVVAGDVLGSQGAQASVEDVLAAALEANQQLTRLVAELREENARQAGELERLRADLAVLQRMLFGRSSERSRPEPSGGGDGCGEAVDGGAQRGSNSGGSGKTRGPGARSGRRDYSDLPRVEMFWDFGEGGYCCPRCAQPFTVLADHVSGEQLDWQVIVRVVSMLPARVGESRASSSPGYPRRAARSQSRATPRPRPARP
jgi:transposase